MGKTIEELLKPRYKVIALWPDSKGFKLWEVIDVGFAHLNSTIERQKEFWDKYPHLFKRLEWWEEREENFINQIQYFKVLTNTFDVVKKGDILDLHDYKYWGFNEDLDNLKYFIPVTEEEFLNHLPPSPNKLRL